MVSIGDRRHQVGSQCEQKVGWETKDEANTKQVELLVGKMMCDSKACEESLRAGVLCWEGETRGRTSINCDCGLGVGGRLTPMERKTCRAPLLTHL